MTRNYNYKAFLPEEVKKGLHLDLINYLLEYNKKSDQYYYDIHITTDGCCTIVEWADCCYRDAGLNEGTFQFVDEGNLVMKQIKLPDGTYEWIDAYIKEEDYIHDWELDNKAEEVGDAE